ncbi:conjugal transfer protein TraK, partial [Phocaeicola vulgatus]|nr:conjugal transfer protein TraK [Odoribacter splanchnicus]
QHHTLTQIIMGLLNNGFELKVVEEADFLEEFDPRYNEEGVSELDEQFERLPDGHEAKRSYYLGFRQAQSEARPNIVISLLKLN